MAYSAAQKREHIFQVQTFLRIVAYSNPNIPMIVPDGIFGEETKVAVEAFQREYFLPVTGEVDYATWKELVLQYNKSMDRVTTPVPVEAFPSPDDVFKEGDRGYTVSLIKIMLSAIADKFPNQPTITMDNPTLFDFTRETTTALKAFQEKSGLKPTGEADLETWTLLARSYGVLLRDTEEYAGT